MVYTYYYIELQVIEIFVDFFFTIIKLRLETSDQFSADENTDEKPQDTKTPPRCLSPS